MICSLSRLLAPSLGKRRLPLLLLSAGLGTASACAVVHSAPPADPQAIEMAAGDFVHAVVVQRSDVRVELLGPDGREVLHVDGPNSVRDDEEIAAVAGRPGLYQLKVLGCPQGVPPDGCYTLRLDPVRPAGAADRRRAEAVRATQEAADAMLVRSEESWHRQLAARERALALWSDLRERRREAEELYQLGGVHQRLRQPVDAARRLHQAAEAWAALGDAAREAEALNEAGLSCVEADHLEHALEDYRQALARSREAGARRQEGMILNNLGLLLSRLGERRQALGHLEEALALARELSDRGEEANTLNNLGSAQADLSETQKALELYKAALAIPEASPGIRAAAYNNLGALHLFLGNWEEAIESLNQALAIVRELEDPYRLASTYNNLGMAQHSSGDVSGARTSYEQALRLAREAGNREVQMVAANNFGILLEQKLGQPAEALSQWRSIADLTADQPDLGYLGLSARAAVERGEGNLEAARATLRRAIPAAERREEIRFAAELTQRLSRVERELGDLPAAAEQARAAVEMTESLRNRVATPDQRALFLASRQSLYASYIDLLMELDRTAPGQGYDTRAFQVSERARARSLLDLLGESGADLRRGVPPELLERDRLARAVLRERDLYHMELIHRGAEPRQIALSETRLREALEQSEEMEAALRASSASYAALTQPQPLDVGEIQRQLLGDRTLLLEYALGEERSYLWAVTADTFQSFELGGRKDIEKLALEVYDAITARDDALAESRGLALSGLILGPVEHLLGNRTLLIISDGVLQYLPFAALPLPSEPGRHVLERNQVVSLPSASALAALRRDVEGRSPAPKTLAVLADPVFTEGDPRLLKGRNLKGVPAPGTPRGLPPRGPNGQEDQLQLPRLVFSRVEAENILGFVADAGQRLQALDFDASYALATSGKLSEYRYVHFATHGLLNSRQPRLSKLALSQFDAAGARVDGFLRLSDIYNLDLNADLVVLSACQTALGKEVRGEGLVGLTRGFMYAGAARVLASLWSVEDRATATLMKSFYRNLLAEKRPAAEALQRAQIETANRPQFHSPYFWAGFSLQGEWK
jgi:CHAT domain-containing protein/tetratricopeptide (TPR) repeat protein